MTSCPLREPHIIDLISRQTVKWGRYSERLLVWFLKVWLPAVKAKGLEISGTFSRRQGHMYMDMNFTNKALQHMTDFAIQFNKNRSVIVIIIVAYFRLPGSKIKVLDL